MTPDLNGMTGLLPVSEANNLLTQNTGQRLSMDSAEGAVEVRTTYYCVFCVIVHNETAVV